MLYNFLGAYALIDTYFKEIKDSILFYLSVPRCVGCGERLNKRDVALCPDCLREYNNIKERNCSICAKRLSECSCTNSYLDTHYVHKLIKVFRYVRRDPMPSNNLIYSLKRDNRKDVLSFLTDELSDAISSSIKDVEKYVFTNVPRRREGIVKYGIDHAALLAKSLAKHFSAEYYQPIISISKRAQKKLSKSERIVNAKFRAKKNTRRLDGKFVILVDDVVTTGASMAACATVLKRLGAKTVVGAAVSIAYKDTYVPFEYGDRYSSFN